MPNEQICYPWCSAWASVLFEREYGIRSQERSKPTPSSQNYTSNKAGEEKQKPWSNMAKCNAALRCQRSYLTVCGVVHLVTGALFACTCTIVFCCGVLPLPQTCSIRLIRAMSLLIFGHCSFQTPWTQWNYNNRRRCFPTDNPADVSTVSHFFFNSVYYHKYTLTFLQVKLQIYYTKEKHGIQARKSMRDVTVTVGGRGGGGGVEGGRKEALSLWIVSRY